MNKYAEFSRQRPSIENRRCLTKADYRSEEKAALTAVHIYAKLGKRQTPYHCPMCFRWHLTSKVPSTHDFRDQGNLMEKRDPKSWSDWTHNQQHEYTPGLGRR